MASLALETEDVISDIYLSLGLKESDKGVGVPRVLSLLSSLLERSVQRNEIKKSTPLEKISVPLAYTLKIKINNCPTK